MAKSRKMVGIVLAVMLAVASMVTSFAASTQDVLLALQDGITFSTGESAYITVEHMQIAKNYLAEKNLSSSDLDTILADIKSVQNVASTVSSMEELVTNAEVTKAINNAANVAGIKVTLTSDFIEVVDSNGKSLVSIAKAASSTFSREKPDYSSVNSTSNSSNTAGSNTAGSNAASAEKNASNSANSVKGSTGASATTTSGSTGVIKQTGAEIDLTNMTIAVSAVLLMLAGAGCAAYKFNLLRD